MKLRGVAWMIIASTLGVARMAAQTPVLGGIETPYLNVQGTVHIANGVYGPGIVGYGPVNTPLVLTGTQLGATGVVQFVGYKDGVPVTTVQTNATMWTSNMVFVNVPAGAFSGLVQVVVEGRTSNGIPFMVTHGTYAGTCSQFPPSNQLQITTSSVHDGAVGQAYDATLNISGGTAPFTWTLPGNTMSWLSLSTSISSSTTNHLVGTPSGATGAQNLTVQVTDSSSPRQTDAAVLSLTIQPQAMAPTTIYSYCVPYPGNSNATVGCNSASGFDSAGNVIKTIDSTPNGGSVMGTWAYSYDTLNRLVSGTASAGDFAGNYACWVYDSFGNRTSEAFSQTTCTGNPPLASWASYNSTNTNRMDTDSTSLGNTNVVYNSAGHQASGVPGYDAAGNITSDGNNTYLYDAEGRICAVKSEPSPGTYAMTGYLYNAEGQRIAKGSITSMSCDPAVSHFQTTASYVLGQGGEELAIFDGNARWQSSNVYGAGRLLGTYDGNGLHFHIADALGTRRMQVSSSGQPETDIQSLPFGDQLFAYTDRYAPSSANDANPLHFAGKERDSESGNDYFGARYYGSSMGRFLSPDPAGPWVADASDPQSWNFYAYARNNPLINIDPTGLDCIYFNDAGTGVESVDPTNKEETLNKQASDCGKNGGNWVNGKVNSVVDDGQGDFNVRSSDANGTYTTAMTAAGPQSNGTDCSGNCIYGYIGPAGPNNDDSLSPYAAAVFTQIGLQTGPTYEMASRAFCSAVTFGQAGAATASIAGAPIKKSWLGFSRAGGEGISTYTTVLGAWGETLRKGGVIEGAGGRFLKSVSTSAGSFAGTARIGGALGRVANKVASSEAAGIVSAVSLACIGGHP